jgi:hypothetical protein
MRYSTQPKFSQALNSATGPVATRYISSRPRSYRCHYHPNDRNGFPAACDTGVLPFVQVKARDAEHAQRVAHDLTGCSISNVERLDEVSA